MPNSFLRRASAPGGEASSATQFDEPLDLKSGDTLAVPEKLPSCRPVSYRNTQPRTISFRPSRFIKGATPSLSTGSTCPPISDDMQSFIHAFDLYSQKVYIEGYLFRHIDAGRRTRCFAELCGSTLSVWDAEVQTPSVMPQYVNISDATVHSCCDENGGDNKRKYFVVNGTKTLKFEATDETTMSRWMCAIRLACFEKKRLHLLFTLKLLLESYDPAADIPAKWDANLQVCTAGSEWQKCRVTINDRTERRGGGGGGIFGGGSKNKSAQQQQENHQLAIYDTKKSKVPYLTVTDITHAYAVYPESPQLITKSCIMRVEGSVMKKDDKQPEHGYVLIMADNCQQMSAGLLAIYDKFKLYGRPESLTTDPTVETALNYGVDPGYPGLFLDLEDVLQCNDVKSAEEPQQVERALLAALHKRLSEPIRPGTGARANSLPLITVAFEDKNNNGPTMRQRSASGDEEKPRPHSPYKLSYQVADSSDESDDDQDDEDNDEEVDSDDEPIGKSRNAQSKQQQQQQQQRSLAESLIPDFDFGNGFDVSQRTQSSSNSSLFEPSDDGYTRSRQTSISITKESTTSSTNATTANNYTAAKEQSTTTSSSSLFGDFSLSLDFPKFDERKYSLPASVKLSEQDSIDRPSSSGCGTSSSGSSILDYSKRRRSFSDDRRARSTDLSYWGEDEYAADEYAAGHHHHRHSYDVESDADLDDDAPIIPSLNDHFAPQNSLLDKYLGDQLTAKEQIEYCRATGQPLIQVSSNKPEIPDSGFVGMISRREKERKEGNYQRVSERVQRHHADRSLLEREKERRLFDQRQQQWMKHQMMLYHNGYMPNHPPMPMMYPPYMGPPPPPGPLTPISPLSPNPGPHPHYMMPPPGGMYMAPAPHMRSGPRSPSISSPVSPGSRRSSRPLLDDIDDELMLSNNNSSPSNHIHPISRAASPVFRKSEQI